MGARPELSTLAVLLAAAVMAVAGCGGGAIADSGPCGQWNVTRTSHSLQAVSAASPRDAWAVGGDTILHWDGRGWKESSSGGGDLYGVAALAPNNAWVAGAGVGGPLLEHWNGKGWSVSPSAPSGRSIEAFQKAGSEAFYGIFEDGPSDVWLVRYWFETRPGPKPYA